MTAPDAAEGGAKKRAGGLNTMLLADLKSLASGMGIRGAGSMKKAQLVDAIKAAQGATSQGSNNQGSNNQGSNKTGSTDQDAKADAPQREQRGPGRGERAEQGGADERGDKQSRPEKQDRPDKQDRGQQQDRSDRQDRPEKQDRGQQDGAQPDGQSQDGQGDDDADGAGGSRRNRRRRGRDRNRERQGTRGEPDTQILEDDILVPAAGILDVLDNYAFVRTSGYLAGPDDVYLSLSMVRKYGLRRGDAIVGQVRQPREGERKEKFNPMVRVDSVNGADPETAKHRIEFAKLTPLYPSERLRLETDATNMIGRVIDIAAPIGKGQRGLIVSPAKAGKTMILQSIANSITANNPECHLMVVLVDERPEEVTDFERSVKGEVISSTFDRPASDHTTVAELAIERAKRLVELGHDVVVLLDGITRLGRAYNLAAPASGRILSGGVDSAALYPPKKFFGAARNIENGGSLTILATALIESGSKMDEVIFEEFKGTGNMEIRLRREFADKRIFPAIDPVQSGTRREELLMSKEELAIIWKLRRVLSALDGQQALELLLERLKKSQTNIEFLMQVQKTTPGQLGPE
ncbi:MAG: transcription termination factor Rho [Nocardioidaceae bacterium]